MDKRIIVTNHDGTIGVIVPSPKAFKTVINKEGKKEKVLMSIEEIGHSVLNGGFFKIVDVESVPKDRSYRNAWELDGSVVIHNMTKAREIHKEKLRALRAEWFALLDLEYQRADENGDNQRKKEIVDKKNILRNITDHPSIAAAQNIDQLKIAGINELNSIHS